MIKYDVPFYNDNTKDGARCVPACFKMILQYFLPNKSFTWQDLDKLTRRVKGKGTWWHGAYPALLRMGFEVKEFSSPKFYRDLLEHGTKSLYKYYKKEIADFYIRDSNIQESIRFIPAILKRKIFVKRTATLKDIENFLQRGFLLIADVDFSKSFAKWYDVSHAVVLTGYDRTRVYFNDPAKRRGKNLVLKGKAFRHAWPSRGLAAFRLKE